MWEFGKVWLQTTLLPLESVAWVHFGNSLGLPAGASAQESKGRDATEAEVFGNHNWPGVRFGLQLDSKTGLGEGPVSVSL